MRLKTNLVIGVLFVALAAFVYLHEIKGEEERRAEAERSSKLLDFSDHEVQRISIARPGDDVVVIERRQDEWWIVEPVDAQADEEAVERYLRNLGETETERAIEDSAALASDTSRELALKYGLIEPRLRCHLVLSEGALDTLYFGADSPTERFAYAQRRGANRQVFTVRAWRFDNLDKGLFDLRDKRLLAFDKGEVRQIDLVSDYVPDSAIRIARSPAGDGWQLESPVRARADKSEVEAILNKLHNTTAESFGAEMPDVADLEEAGLAPAPSLRVNLTVGEDRAIKTFRVGNPTGDQGHFFARDASRAPIFLIDSTVVKELGKSLWALRDKDLLPIDAHADIQRLELYRSQHQVFVAERDSSGSWVIVAPEKRQAKTWKVNGLLTDVVDAQVEEFVVDVPAGATPDLAAYGFDPPRARLRLDLSDSAEAVELLLGAPVDGGVYAMIAGSPTVARVSAQVLESLDVELDDVSQAPPTDPDESAGSGASADVDASGDADVSAGSG